MIEIREKFLQKGEDTTDPEVTVLGLVPLKILINN